MIGRRRFLFSTTILAAVGTATFGWAADAKDAEVLVTNLVADINAVISSGSSESVMVRQFENIFKSYADVPTIARYALGNDARALSKSQMKRFTKVYSVCGCSFIVGSDCTSCAVVCSSAILFLTFSYSKSKFSQSFSIKI